MPLTKTGTKVLRRMQDEYDSKEKGREVFYATMNKYKDQKDHPSHKWHIT